MLKQKEIDSIGIGIAFPIKFSEGKNDQLLDLATGVDIINQSIRLILGTRIGERYNNNQFGCFSGDTLIPLLDGRELPIKELVGIETWVYGIYNGFVRPVLTAGAVSQGLQKVIRVTLDNNKQITCTPNHLFLLREGSWKKAEDLIFGDSLMPLYRKKDKKGYEETYVPLISKWIKTHRLLLKNIKKGLTVHHIDFNKKNNLPSNLKVMGCKEHFLFHSKHTKKLFEPGMPLNIYWSDPKNKLAAGQRGTKVLEAINKKRREDPEYASFVKECGKQYYLKTKESRDLKKEAKNLVRNSEKEAKKIINKKMRSNLGKTVGAKNFVSWIRSKEGKEHITQLGKSRLKNISKEDIINCANTFEGTTREKLFTYICKKLLVSKSLLKRRVKLSELNPSIKKANKWHNHKVICVEPINDTIEVFDLTNTETENFALSAGVFVHNSNINDLIFEPNDLILKDLLYYSIVTALQRWEKRITILEVNFDEQSEHLINIIISYKINSTHTVGSYVYPFVRNAMPMNEVIQGSNSFNLSSANIRK